MVRQRREPAALAGHLAQRGLGHLRPVVVERGTGGTTAEENFDEILDLPADDEFWNLAIADPQPLGLFADPVYDRGAATLHALRVKVGDTAFFAGAKLWLTRYNDSNGTTEDFQAVYEEVSGQDLQEFFDTWVMTPEKPTVW